MLYTLIFFCWGNYPEFINKYCRSLGPDLIEDHCREELLRLKVRKSTLDDRIHALEPRTTIEINLENLKKAKSAASQIVLKRLMRRVIDPLCLNQEGSP